MSANLWQSKKINDKLVVTGKVSQSTERLGCFLIRDTSQMSSATQWLKWNCRSYVLSLPYKDWFSPCSQPAAPKKLSDSPISDLNPREEYFPCFMFRHSLGRVIISSYWMPWLIKERFFCRSLLKIFLFLGQYGHWQLTYQPADQYMNRVWPTLLSKPLLFPGIYRVPILPFLSSELGRDISPNQYSSPA